MGLLFLDGPTVTVVTGTSSPTRSSASSSAAVLADLALVWSNDAGAADLAMIDDDLASDTGMTTAVLLSLMLDRRARNDDVPPSGDPTDMRGWWADQFADVEGDLVGSRLWLLERSKQSAETARLAKEYVLEALKWMIDDKVAASIDVAIDNSTNGQMFIALTLQRPGRKAISFRFAHVWDAAA